MKTLTVMTASLALLACAAAVPSVAQDHMTADRGAAPAPFDVEGADARAQLEDIAVFEDQFFKVDRAYAPEARAEATARLARMKAEAGQVSNGRMILELSQIVALADNGHTFMVTRGPGFGRAGLRLALFGDRYFVVRAKADHAEILGGELIAIDGKPIAELRAAGRTLIGGIPAWRDRQAMSFLESPRQLHALGLAREPDQATYRLRMPDGREIDTVLATTAPPNALARGSGGMIDPFLIEGWPTLLAPDKAPWSERDFDHTFRRRDAPELDAEVVQLHGIFDSKTETVAGFIRDAEKEREASGRKNFVLDMRFNGGGNLQLTRDVLSSLPGLLPPDGKMVVLTSPWTFSAAISSTGYVKQAGGDKVILVGEAPGDRLRFFAEGKAITLPNSQAGVLFATERHDYLTGCKGFTDCHHAVVAHPIAVKSLDPDVPAPPTIEAYRAGRDPGMEAVARVLGKAR